MKGIILISLVGMLIITAFIVVLISIYFVYENTQSINCSDLSPFDCVYTSHCQLTSRPYHEGSSGRYVLPAIIHDGCTDIPKEIILERNEYKKVCEDNGGLVVNFTNCKCGNYLVQEINLIPSLCGT